MSLIKAERNWCVTNAPPALSHYGSWLSWVNDQDLRHAMLAANINILRRRAPFAYLFANKISPDEKLETIYMTNGASPDDRYVSALDVQRLRLGVWLPYPDYQEPTVTAVTSLLDGDILPFVYFLDGDNYSVLCLPAPLTLDQIDQTICDAGSSQGALEVLLRGGGCHIHIIDGLSFSVTTYDHGYAEHFLDMSISKFEIRPLFGVSPIALGMTRQESRQAMGGRQVLSYQKGSESEAPTDGYFEGGFQLFFDSDERAVHRTQCASQRCLQKGRRI